MGSIILPLPCLCKSEKSDRKVGKVGSCIIYRSHLLQLQGTVSKEVAQLPVSYNPRTVNTVKEV
ncbi:hypothetical protein QUB58_26870 [Microcoleus sp. B4-D1]|uniref:hypothetical protein n=1 Tax=Microcoleus sp. B4-C5 TaxID=2818664 RepID=UPI002FD0B080